MEKFLTNTDLLEIWTSYDAYYFTNKNGEATTHKENFDRLFDLLKLTPGCCAALDHILFTYDSYYKNEYDNKDSSNPFYYLQCKINELENKKTG